MLLFHLISILQLLIPLQSLNILWIFCLLLPLFDHLFQHQISILASIVLFWLRWSRHHSHLNPLLLLSLQVLFVPSLMLLQLLWIYWFPLF